MIHCSNCGTQNPEGTKFCTNCGAPALNSRPQDPCPPKGSPWAPISTGGYVGSLLLMWVPVIGWIIAIIWCCGGTKNQNRRNLAKAGLILLAVGILLSLILGFALGRLGSGILPAGISGMFTEAEAGNPGKPPALSGPAKTRKETSESPGEAPEAQASGQGNASGSKGPFAAFEQFTGEGGADPYENGGVNLGPLLGIKSKQQLMEEDGMTEDEADTLIAAAIGDKERLIALGMSEKEADAAIALISDGGSAVFEGLLSE